MNNSIFAAGMNGIFTIIGLTTNDLAVWVAAICSAVIAIATCVLQVYKMYKNRDNVEVKPTEETKKEEDEDDDTRIN